MIERCCINDVNRWHTKSGGHRCLQYQITPPLIAIEVCIGPGIPNHPPVPFLDLRLGHRRLNKKCVLSILIEEWACQSFDQKRRIEPIEPVHRYPVPIQHRSWRRIAGKEQLIVASLLENGFVDTYNFGEVAHAGNFDTLCITYT